MSRRDAVEQPSAAFDLRGASGYRQYQQQQQRWATSPSKDAMTMMPLSPQAARTRSAKPFMSPGDASPPGLPSCRLSGYSLNYEDSRTMQMAAGETGDSVGEGRHWDSPLLSPLLLGGRASDVMHEHADGWLHPDMVSDRMSFRSGAADRPEPGMFSQAKLHSGMMADSKVMDGGLPKDMHSALQQQTTQQHLHPIYTDAGPHVEDAAGRQQLVSLSPVGEAHAGGGQQQVVRWNGMYSSVSAATPQHTEGWEVSYHIGLPQPLPSPAALPSPSRDVPAVRASQDGAVLHLEAPVLEGYTGGGGARHAPLYAVEEDWMAAPWQPGAGMRDGVKPQPMSPLETAWIQDNGHPAAVAPRAVARAGRRPPPIDALDAGLSWALPGGGGGGAGTRRGSDMAPRLDGGPLQFSAREPASAVRSLLAADCAMEAGEGAPASAYGSGPIASSPRAHALSPPANSSRMEIPLDDVSWSDLMGLYTPAASMAVARRSPAAPLSRLHSSPVPQYWDGPDTLSLAMADPDRLRRARSAQDALGASDVVGTTLAAPAARPKARQQPGPKRKRLHPSSPAADSGAGDDAWDTAAEAVDADAAAARCGTRARTGGGSQGRLGQWSESAKKRLVDLVEKLKPKGSRDWEEVAERLGRCSRGAASAERMYRTLTDPGYRKSNNKHGRRVNSRTGTPMHIMAAYGLSMLPSREGNLTDISAVIERHPVFTKQLDRTPRPGTKTYPRWKDALVGCFKEGRYPHLVKTHCKRDGLTVYSLLPHLVPAHTKEAVAAATAQATAAGNSVAAGVSASLGSSTVTAPAASAAGGTVGGMEHNSGSSKEAGVDARTSDCSESGGGGRRTARRPRRAAAAAATAREAKSGSSTEEAEDTTSAGVAADTPASSVLMSSAALGGAPAPRSGADAAADAPGAQFPPGLRPVRTRRRTPGRRARALLWAQDRAVAHEDGEHEQRSAPAGAGGAARRQQESAAIRVA